MNLPWPLDPTASNAAPGHGQAAAAPVRLDVPGSNLVLDLHGSPLGPELVLFMAGNQFPALPALLAAFAGAGGPTRVFHATAPPGLLIDALAAGRLAVGNLVLELQAGAGAAALWPDAFMAGPREFARLRTLGLLSAQDGDAPVAYARNRGCVLLVRRGNPLGLRGVPDLLRPEVRVAISSPEREPASYASYAATLDAQGGAGLARALLERPGTRTSQRVHHREVPQLLADGLADAAPLFAHLACYLVEAAPDCFEAVPLPEAANARDTLSIAPMHGAAHPSAARAWRDFLCSPVAVAILERHGFDGPAA